MAASVGLVQSDIKKIIAYSTCSQLGYMFFTCGLPSYEISFFHSSNHAFFKALLFLTAGSLIHSLAGEQDTRKFGGFDKPFPLAGAVGLIGSLALMGFPSLAGYYSKEMILEFTFAKYTISAMTVYLFGLTTAIFTAFYSFRVLFAGFLATTNAGRLRTKKTIESDLEIICVLVFLGLASTSVGYITKDLFIGLGNDLWNVNLFIQPHNTTLTDSEYIDPMVKLLPLIWSVISITTSYILLYINAHFGILLNPFTGFIKTTGIYWFLGQK
jgi:NADH:ubiquinone oxidoreductase subunit 5 (subunit L)/multisubunit Na+/H+ antiporter MnhA subunit